MATSIFAELRVGAGPGAAPDLGVIPLAVVRLRGRWPLRRGRFQGDARLEVNS